MKRYSSIIHILSLACAGLIFVEGNNQSGWSRDGASTCEFRSFARLPGAKFWDRYLPCLVRRWQGRRKLY